MRAFDADRRANPLMERDSEGSWCARLITMSEAALEPEVPSLAPLVEADVKTVEGLRLADAGLALRIGYAGAAARMRGPGGCSRRAAGSGAPSGCGCRGRCDACSAFGAPRACRSLGRGGFGGRDCALAEALDGKRAGRTHRQIAKNISGAAKVAAERRPGGWRDPAPRDAPKE